MKYHSFSLAIVTLSFLISTGASAQRKVGYINLDDLIAVMPETKQAQQALQASADSLSRIDGGLQQAFVTARDAFFRDSASMDTAKKEAQRKVLQKLILQDNQFRADAKGELDSLQQTMSAAIEARAVTVLTATAKANGFAYVFRKTVGAENQQRQFVILGPEGDDLLPLVKKQLGLSTP